MGKSNNLRDLLSRESQAPHSDDVYPSCEVTVVVPAYNAAAFIAEALDSVARQTLLPAEVIVINDGSVDGTAAVVEDWVHKNRGRCPLHLISQTNCGLPVARNVGIRRAIGKWIALLDADDIWEPAHLQELMDATRVWPAAVGAYGAGRLLAGGTLSEQLYDNYWDSPSQRFGKHIDSSHCRLIDFAVFPRLVKGSFIKPSSLMFSRAVAMEIGLFNEELRTAGEREFQTRLIHKGALVYSPVPVTQYRWHDDNISQNKNAKRNMGNGLRALQLIRSNLDLMLTDNELDACLDEIRQLAKEYLYLCSKEDWRSYGDGVSFLAALSGWGVAISAVRLSHLAQKISLGE